MQFEQFVRVDGNRRVCLDCRRGGDGTGDDLTLHQKALNPRIDQAGAKLGKKRDADREGEQAGDVENYDPPREAREALNDKELPDTQQQAANPGETVTAAGGVALVERRLYLSLSRGRCIGVVTGPCAFYGSIEHVVCRGFDQPASCRSAGCANAINSARRWPPSGPFRA